MYMDASSFNVAGDAMKLNETTELCGKCIKGRANILNSCGNVTVICGEKIGAMYSKCFEYIASTTSCEVADLIEVWVNANATDSSTLFYGPNPPLPTGVQANTILVYDTLPAKGRSDECGVCLTDLIYNDDWKDADWSPPDQNTSLPCVPPETKTCTLADINIVESSQAFLSDPVANLTDVGCASCYTKWLFMEEPIDNFIDMCVAATSSPSTAPSIEPTSAPSIQPSLGPSRKPTNKFTPPTQPPVGGSSGGLRRAAMGKMTTFAAGLIAVIAMC